MLVENYGLLSDIVPYSPIKLEFKCKWAGFIPWYNMRICILYHSLRFVSNVEKHNTTCVAGYHYTETNTNKVNKT
jgi:hypothetical protein